MDSRFCRVVLGLMLLGCEPNLIAPCDGSEDCPVGQTCQDDYCFDAPLVITNDARPVRDQFRPDIGAQDATLPSIDVGARDATLPPVDLSEPDLPPPDPACQPQEEQCNGRDDDCDRIADEGFGVGDPCSVGRGECEAPGVFQCDAGGVICTAEPGAAQNEMCNGLDDDCDGQADEGFDVGGFCQAGVGGVYSWQLATAEDKHHNATTGRERGRQADAATEAGRSAKIAYGVGGALVAGSILLWVLDTPEDSVALHPSGSGLSLSGRF